MIRLRDFIINLRNKFFKKKIEACPRRTVNYSEAQHIGILFLANSPKEQTGINRFVSDLQKDGKRIKALTFLEKIGNNPYFFSYETFSHKNISHTGKIHSAEVDKFINTRFDYLFCVISKPFPIFEYVMRKSQAKCRVGRYFIRQDSCYELMISLNPHATQDILISEMLAFMRRINANESCKKNNSSVQALP